MSDTLRFTEYQAGTLMHGYLCLDSHHLLVLRSVNSVPIAEDSAETWQASFPKEKLITREEAAAALVEGRRLLNEAMLSAVFDTRKAFLEERERLLRTLKEAEEAYVLKLRELLGRDLRDDELATAELDCSQPLPAVPAADRLAAKRDADEWRKFEESLTPEDHAKVAAQLSEMLATRRRDEFERGAFARYRAFIDSVEARHRRRR